ncbi:MAG TPA: DUF1553 domain-containing protein, partial [Planctomycetia bacterium]|nr:DUF1553 domain-containing protein [Planctomycetia bacterium]
LPAGMRAIDLPDEAGASYLLDVFGRPQRASACECERSSEANLGQSLHLLNGAEVQAKLANQAGRAVKLADDKRPDREKLTELYAWFFARTPTGPELKVATEYLAAAKDKRVAWQNLVWALLNSKEFCFNL